MEKPVDILYEDNHLIVVNKKISDIVQGDKTGDKSLDKIIKNHIKERDNKPGEVFLGIPHRLDRPVSGVVVFAKTSKALSRMAMLFKEKEIEKVYYAITKELPDPIAGTLENYIARNTKQNKSYCYSKPGAETKHAVLHYRVLSSSERYHLIEIILETGRHHQIRAQLSSIGCPIKGDLKYNSKRSNKNGGISLHARKISFIHPVKQEPIEIIAPFPPGDIFEVFGI